MKYDPDDTWEVSRAKEGQRTVRPRDAATLILVRGSGANIEILMGQRSGGHVFMPNKFVFPGGRVDKVDSYIAPAAPLQTHVVEKLTHGCTPKKAQALALAAVRETFEETGLLVGQKTPGAKSKTKSAPWKSFFDNGVSPRLDIMEFIARAITPPNRSRRFDARFFIADAEHIQGDLHDTSNASGELLDLKWFDLDAARELDLPSVTREMMDIIEAHLTASDPKNQPIPFMHFHRGAFITEHI
jgi:8-oxo-dGTP pyrophosphatase MutT (NUDIX family)